jgi:ferredoxin
MTYVIDPTICTGCGACIEACPAGAITFDGECARIDPDLCVECGTCADECPTGAITESA